MRPLHSYPVFTAPRSPITTYKATCVRCELRVSEHLAATSLWIAVPTDDSPDARPYADAAINKLGQALNTLT